MIRPLPVLVSVVAFAVLVGAASPQAAPPPRPPFRVVEASIAEMRAAMESGRTTSREIVEQSLLRIARYEDRLNAVLVVNPRALEEAEARDRERAAGKVRGPLHGIPIALKDNIQTTDMPTTGGALAFDGLVPPYEATLVKHLRDAGAVIIAKTTMTELANWVASAMPTNYNALKGFAFNPYDPRRDPRDATADGRPALATGGSSSGGGTAASFWAANVGTETSGSILSPANQNSLVGIKPTVGRISRHGIIPITADQDTAGPIARTVADAATLLGVIAGYDPADPATAACLTPGNCHDDYTQFLDKKALKRAHIAVLTPIPGNRLDLMNAAIEVLRAEGATVDFLPSPFPPQLGVCVSYPPPSGCSTVLLYGQKHDLDLYLAATPGAPHHTLAEIVAFNSTYVPPMKYGQAIFEAANQLDVSPGSADTQRYLADRAADLALSRGALDDVYDGADGIAGTEDDVDAILASANSFAATPAKAGYPSVTVPGGFVPAVAPIENPFPSGVTFSGPAFSEPRLIALAYAFEQATHHRVPPASTPPLPSDSVTRP
jgi:amidase